MKEEINFGIGFITGRPNVCNIINNYCKYIIEQVKQLDKKVNFIFFVLYDLNYLNAKEQDFYKIRPEVKEHIRIKYLTPDYVLQKKDEVMKKHNLKESESDLLIGKGYARARNTILYEAVQEKIDYLLFWDDDEYPVASLKNGKDIQWIKQNNVLQHLKYIKDADITYGYRCGIMNLLPYIEYNDVITEEIYKEFIEAMENEVVSWNKVQYMLKNDSGIEYAEKEIATGACSSLPVEKIGKKNFVLGSGICLNLKHLDKIPAFYNPPEARGEDTFFSCALADTGAKVIRIPTYHFHDGFLKYKFLMEDKFPKTLRKITSKDDEIETRFLKTAKGWIKYKPLLYYILNKDTYKQEMTLAKEKLDKTAKIVSTAFKNCDLTVLKSILQEYDENVEKHYKEYKEINEVWDKVKFNIR